MKALTDRILAWLWPSAYLAPATPSWAQTQGDRIAGHMVTDTLNARMTWLKLAGPGPDVFTSTFNGMTVLTSPTGPSPYVSFKRSDAPGDFDHFPLSGDKAYRLACAIRRQVVAAA